MWIRDDHTNVLSLFAPPVLVAASFYLISLLPSEIMIVLVAWVLISFPVGVLIGHCVLREK